MLSLIFVTTKMSRVQDFLGVLRGIQSVAQEGVKVQGETLKLIWENSSVRNVAAEIRQQVEKPATENASKKPTNFVNVISETSDKLTTVVKGVQEFVSNAPAVYITAKEPDRAKVPQIQVQEKLKPKTGDYEIKLTTYDKELLKKLDMEHQAKIKTGKSAKVESDSGKHKSPKQPVVPTRQELSASAKQRSVPSSRISRIFSFGSLAAGLGLGTAAEYARRTLGLTNPHHQSDLFLTPANMDRIVDTLCKVRGAALKLGQVLSIQDETVVSPELAKALERVRKSADFMPSWQVDQVMQRELGAGWRNNFLVFEDRPFAAASIGQVHWAKTMDGKEVAIKIQYPGVAKGIESDIDNLVGIIKVWDMFPKALFLDNLIAVAKRELAWEVDYIREAECTRKFRKLLQPHKEYCVPKVIDNLSTAQVFTTELMEGIPVDQCVDMDVEHRNFIAMKTLELCLLELFKFRYMQTDPNWANFLYDPKNKRLLLLDFGASREYSKSFMDKYVRILRAAADGDRETVLYASRDVGFLTGYESKLMEQAHVDAVMILGEVFRCPGDYNFAAQETTSKITHLMPTMLTHRLCPPPEEVYSLHRKLSGVYLLCAKLKVSIPVRKRFLELIGQYEFDKS